MVDVAERIMGGSFGTHEEAIFWLNTDFCKYLLHFVINCHCSLTHSTILFLGGLFCACIVYLLLIYGEYVIIYVVIDVTLMQRWPMVC